MILQQADRSGLEVTGKIVHDDSEMTANRGNEGSEATGNGQNKLLTTGKEGLEGETITREALAAWCEASNDAGDWHEAVRRWRKFRQDYPEDVWGFVKESIALAEIGVFPETMALLSTAERQFQHDPAVDLGFAEVAMAQKDYERAATRWHKLRTEHPELTWGFVGSAKVLLATGQLDEAEQVLEDFLRAFPDESTALVNYAECAGRRQDWPEALSRWQAVKAKCPESHWGYLGEADTLISLQRIDEARAAMSVIRKQYPGAASHLDRLARNLVLAEQRAPIDPTLISPRVPAIGASEKKAAPVEDRPDRSPSFASSDIDAKFVALMSDWFDPVFYCSVYSDIDTSVVDPAAHYHYNGWKEHRDPGPKFCTDHYLSTYPDAKSASINPLIYHTLIGEMLGHVPAKSLAITTSGDDGVSEVAGNGQNKLITAGDGDLQRGGTQTREALAAWCEESSNAADWPEAVERWQKFGERHPSDVWGFVKQAIALVNIGDGSTGMALLTAAERQFPDDPAVDLGFAEVAMVQRSYDRAATHWRNLREQHPELSWGFTGEIQLLLQKGQYDDADRAVEDLLAAFPDDISGLIQYAECAQRRQQWLEALSRWREVISKHPENLWGYVGEADALISMRQIAEASAAMQILWEKFPGGASSQFARLSEKIAAAVQDVPAEDMVTTPAEAQVRGGQDVSGWVAKSPLGEAQERPAIYDTEPVESTGSAPGLPPHRFHSLPLGYSRQIIIARRTRMLISRNPTRRRTISRRVIRMDAHFIRSSTSRITAKPAALRREARIR